MSSELGKIGHRYITGGYVTEPVRFWCRHGTREYLRTLYDSKIRLARHLLEIRPYVWRSVCAGALNDAAFIRRNLWRMKAEAQNGHPSAQRP